MLNPLQSVLPTLERMFQIRRTVLKGEDAILQQVASGLPAGQVARLDGLADGKPFVLFLITDQ